MPIGELELRRQGELRELLQARADACAGIAGAADRDQHVLADAGGHGHRRGLDGGDTGGAAHRHEHRELQIGQAEIGYKILGDAAAREVGHHAVDVARAQPRIGDGGQARLELQRQPALRRAARISGFADATDGSLLSQRMRHVVSSRDHGALPPGKREALERFRGLEPPCGSSPRKRARRRSLCHGAHFVRLISAGRNVL